MSLFSGLFYQEGMVGFSKYNAGDPTPKAYKLLAGIIILTPFVLWGIFSSFTVVGVGQVNVITRLGSVDREVGSGVHLKLPYGIEKNNKFDIKTQKDQADAEASSQDLQDVRATVVTNYHIEAGKVGELFRTVGVDYKDRIIDPAIQESLKASTAQYPIGELITRRANVKATALKALQARLEPRGIKIEDISLTNFEFGAAYKQAITQKQVAEQDALKAKFAADKAANDAQAEINKAKGDAEAQRLRQTTLTPELLQQQAIARWNGVLPVYSGSGSNFFLNLPTGK